jgi:hypothetical protein
MRNRKVLFLLFGIFLAAIGFTHSRVCIAATQTNSHPPINENYLDGAIIDRLSPNRACGAAVNARTKPAGRRWWQS